MKKLLVLSMVIFITCCVFAQSPQKMSYQFVVRNPSDKLVTNQAVGVKISILQGSATGSVVFAETYSPNPQTNANGLVSIEIGGGSALTGTFSAIDWASGPYFLKTETDPAGGTNYTISGTSQLLSVPYAMHAKTAENGFSGSYSDLTNKPTLFSGNYDDLTNKPTLLDGTWANITGKPTTLAGYGITDAMNTSHAANGITSGLISNWNTAYSWGNHAGLYRPISYVPSWNEVTGKPTTLSGYGITDAMSTSHTSNGITPANITNWNAAFGWGNHAGLYRPISYVPSWNEVTSKPTTLSGYGITDADGSVTNEIQTLSLSGTQLSLSNGGGTVIIPGDNWGNQIVVTNATLSGSGTTATPLIIADNGVTSDKIANNAVTVAKLPAGASADNYLRGDGTWAIPSTGSITETDPTWSGAANETVDIGRTGRVGIGTTSPAALLHTQGTGTGQGNVVFVGEYNGSNPGDPPVSGSGTRMMWYPNMAAFRAGYVSGSEWDQANIGPGSIALGWGTTASGFISTAIGAGATASGDYSTAMGLNTNASAYMSTTIGRYNAGVGNATTWVATDPLFEIGNGASNAVHSNAMTVLKNGNVGIGTTSPAALLHTQGTGIGQGNVVFVGQHKDTNPGNPPVSGEGTRMMWYADKSAFRAGYVGDSQWDAANIGFFSIATGYNNTASGDYSTAMGATTTASGEKSTAMGAGTNASGENSTAMGFATTASGISSTAMGAKTNASGDASTAIGYNNIASAETSTAMGASTTASGKTSTAMGSGTNASGENSTAMGSTTTASGDISTAMGFGTIAFGRFSTALGESTTAWGWGSVAMGYHSLANAKYSTALGESTDASGYVSTALGYSTYALGWGSTAMGFHTAATGYVSTALGHYNVGGGNATTWVNTDPLFEIGNGTSVVPHNAMTVLKNGNVGIGTSTPTGVLNISGNSDPTFPLLLLTENENDYTRLMFKNTSTSSKNWTIAGLTSATDDYSYLNFYYDNGSIGQNFITIMGNGNVGIGAIPNYKLDVRGTIGNNTTLYHSDIRWKTDIKPIKYGINELMRLNSISYLWKVNAYPEMGFDKGPQFGFIAQEFEKVIPELVRTDKDGYKSIDYVKLTPILVVAIQEQQKEIEELKGLVNRLIANQRP
jgi:hypothetical protein